MPLDPAIAAHNKSSNERLRALVARLDDAALARKQKNGWTVAQALLHVAFWDRHRLELLESVRNGKDVTGYGDADVLNDALAPLFVAVPLRDAARLAVEAADAVDALVLALSDAEIEKALALPNPPSLDRGDHREDHLDQIEALLKG
jgi:uncharacterized damage-inducible protein DinB